MDRLSPPRIAAEAAAVRPDFSLGPHHDDAAEASTCFKVGRRDDGTPSQEGGKLEDLVLHGSFKAASGEVLAAGSVVAMRKQPPASGFIFFFSAPFQIGDGGGAGGAPSTPRDDTAWIQIDSSGRPDVGNEIGSMGRDRGPRIRLLYCISCTRMAGRRSYGDTRRRRRRSNRGVQEVHMERSADYIAARFFVTPRKAPFI